MSTGFKKCGKDGCENRAETNQAHCAEHLFRLSLNLPEPETVSCRFCGENTIRMATRMCDGCWELKNLLRCVDYDVLMEIIRDIDKKDLNKIVQGDLARKDLLEIGDSSG